MKLQFDCPICEERFLGPAQPNNAVKCPSCSHQFASAGTQHDSAAPPVVQPPQFSPKQLASQRSQPPPLKSKQLSPTELESPEFDPSKLVPPDSQKNSVREPLQKPSSEPIEELTAKPAAEIDPNRKTVPLAPKSHPILIILGLLLLCCILGALLFYSVTRPNSTAAALEGNQPNATSTDLENDASVESGKFDAAEPATKISDEPADAGEASTESELDDEQPSDRSASAGPSDAIPDEDHSDLNGPNSDDNSEDSDAKIRAKLDDAIERNRSAESDTNPETIEKPPMQEPRFSMIKSSVADDVWDDIQPSLVDLVIETPFGNKRATGLIVDSRGWMLTSHSACLGASKIRLTASVSSLLRLQSGSPLSDFARGVIGVDPANDLALLSINRRFTSLNKISTADRDFIVKGRRLIQCTPPTEELPYPVAEVQIHDRGLVGKLRKRNQTAISEMESQLLKESPIDWIVHSINEATCPGAVLADETGVVQAMNVFQTTERGYAVPVAQLGSLLAEGEKANGVKKISVLTPPEAKLPDVPKETTVAPIDVPETPKEDLGVLPFDHPFGKTSLDLNQFFKACNSFQWSPQNRGNFLEVQTAAEAFYNAQQLLIDQANDKTTASTVSNQLEYWNKHVLEMQRANDDIAKMIDTSNTHAAVAILKSDGFFMAFVKHYELDLKDELLIVNVVGTDCYISFPFDEKIKPMVPGDTWVLFGKTPPTAAVTVRPANDREKIKHHAVHVFHQFGKVN